MERKKINLLILGLSILLLSVVGVTYAYWNLNLEQTDEDNLATSCFDVELMEEKNAIHLEKAYPIVDKEGEELTPYTFKLKNKCKANVKYQINLETLNTVGGESIEEDRLASHYIKEKLNEIEKDGSIRLLTDNEQVTPTLEDAEESYKLMTGYMTENEEKTFELRLWMDENITVNDVDAMEKTFASKITIVATYAKEAKKTLEETILALDHQTEDSRKSGIYEVKHDDANITYTNDSFYQKRLQQTEYRYAGKDPNNYVSFGEKVAEDRFELIMCLQGVCSNIHSFGLLTFESVFSSQEQCDIVKLQVENSYGEEFNFKCQQTQKMGELLYWRIIGLVNTPEGQRVKLIRDTSIGNYSWDSSLFDVNEGDGVNEWSQSDLMKLLNPDYDENKDKICDEDQCTSDNLVNNSLYWNGGNGFCYNDANNSASPCDFTNNTIPDSLKNMIETVTWNSGAGDDSYDTDATVSKYYEYERSSNIVKTCDSSFSDCDEVKRITSWKGKVGLMYPSDYGYATSGDINTTRTMCLEKFDWFDYNECFINDWLYTSYIYHTLSPDSVTSHSVFFIDSGGYVDSNYAYLAEGVRPSIYLKPDIFVSLGNGSKESPYILEY